MCTRCADRVSIFCILPPYILRNIADKGSSGQRHMALETLSSDQTFRSLRMVTPMATSRRPRAAAAQRVRRMIFDAAGQEALPGNLVRAEGAGPTGDLAVDEAYDALGATWDFYAEVFDRDSIDDRGLGLDATVHYGNAYDNAFWDGQRMVFGDGDGQLFNRFTIALDVVGHELAHGVTEVEAGLIYQFQPGALNESLSDVFGSLIKQKHLNQTTRQADWLIGTGLLGPAVQGEALRSMKAPGTAYDDDVLGKDPQPGHMRDFVHTNRDNGGVHINSGIPNRAFYLAATALGGHAWDKAGRIWYDALRDRRLRSNTGFRSFARLTRDVAARNHGTDSVEAKAVAEAWAEVGIRLR